MANKGPMDFSGDSSRPKEHMSPLEGFDGGVTKAQREVMDLRKAQMTPIPDAAKDGLGKESAMSQMKAAPEQSKQVNEMLKNPVIIGAMTKSDTQYSASAVMAADAKVFGKKANAA